jgi:asparagine synthase (glutamine-hydrolysing)
VALSGLGGDELFGAYGYSRLGSVALRLGRAWRHVPGAVRHFGATTAARITGHDAGRVEAILDSRSAGELHCAWRTLFSRDEIAAMTGDELELSPRWASDPARDLRAQLRTVDLNTYLRPVLLRDTDVFSMAHGVELRVPLVDRRLFEAVEAAGPGFDRASFARQASEPLLVECAAEPKLPFSLPWGRWLEGPLRSLSVTLTGGDPWHGVIDAKAARACLAQSRGRNSLRTWALLVLAQWLASSSEPCASETDALAHQEASAT